MKPPKIAIFSYNRTSNFLVLNFVFHKILHFSTELLQNLLWYCPYFWTLYFTDYTAFWRKKLKKSKSAKNRFVSGITTFGGVFWNMLLRRVSDNFVSKSGGCPWVHRHPRNFDIKFPETPRRSAIVRGIHRVFLRKWERGGVPDPPPFDRDLFRKWAFFKGVSQAFF